MYKPALIATALFAALPLTGCQHHFTNQDLHGTWTSTSQTLNSRGKNHTEKILVMDIDEDGLITGNSEWRLITGEGGHDGDTPTTSGREDLLGSFDAVVTFSSIEQGCVHAWGLNSTLSTSTPL